MENNRDEAYRCIELTKLHIKNKDLENALKFSIKANRLFPTSETKRLKNKLRLSLIVLKSTKKHNESDSDNSDTFYNGDDSNSTSNYCNIQKSTKKSKRKYKSKTAYSFSFKMSKEMNKDESYKCIEKAKQYIQSKQFDLAEKVLLKSKKLFHLSEADSILKSLQELRTPKYTKEQANLVERVKNSENFYKMLDINTTATIIEIKKAYKKLALLLHPDKNPAPGSGEVFIDVSNAVNTLCDHTKRKTYDQTLKKPTVLFHHYTESHFTDGWPQSTYNTSHNVNKKKTYDRFYRSSSDSSDYDDYYSENEIFQKFDFYDNYDY